MRILDVVSSLNPTHGGVAEGIRQMAAATIRLGHRHEVLTLDAPGAAWLRGFPAPTHALGPGRGRHAYAPSLPGWLRAHATRFDAVVVHGLWQHPGRAVRSALRGTGTPYFVFPHGMLDPWFRQQHPIRHLKKAIYWAAVERHVLRDAAAVLYTSDAEAARAALSFRPYDVRQAVVGYGVAPAQGDDASAFLDAHPALRGQRLVLFLGRIDPKKGCDLLIEACAAEAAREPRLHLVMAGPDDAGWSATLRRRACELGIDGRITWPGMLQGAMKASALRAAEVFALPSHQENFGVAVAEALAAGRPVLVSTCVNTWREIVQAGAGLAGPDTAAGMSSLLARWLALPAEARTAMSACAVECHARHFHIDAVAERLIAVLRDPGIAIPAQRTAPVHGLAT